MFGSFVSKHSQQDGFGGVWPLFAEPSAQGGDAGFVVGAVEDDGLVVLLEGLDSSRPADGFESLFLGLGRDGELGLEYLDCAEGEGGVCALVLSGKGDFDAVGELLNCFLGEVSVLALHFCGLVSDDLFGGWVG